MLRDLIDETLEALSPSELSRLYWSVGIWERAGQMTEAEAAAWRARIRTWQRRGSIRSGRRTGRFPATLDSPRDLKILD
jgi:hypothetical protein